MKIKIGINGMGRIGRMIIRSVIENDNKNIEIKHINNRTNSEACSTLLKYDSIHGKFNTDIDFNEKNLIINKKKINFYYQSLYQLQIFHELSHILIGLNRFQSLIYYLYV